MSRKTIVFVSILFLCLNVFSQMTSSNRIYEIWDDQPAPNKGKDYSRIQVRAYPADPDWEAHSYPLGNGFMGANIFLNDSTQLKLDPAVFPHKEVAKTIENASTLGYEKLKELHLRDYQNLFSRVNLEISYTVPQVPTKTLVYNYKQDASDIYLEELMFHFERYLLISSSRKGTLPCGLQGVWSQYHVTPWSGGYWHNINVQMNYWGAFSTNLAETFSAYEEYFNAYLPKAYANGSKYIKKWHPDAWVYSENGMG